MNWQPIGTAPKDGTVVILMSILNGKIVNVRQCTFNGLGWYEPYSGAGFNYPTHWMPLPPPPKEQP